MKKIVLATLLIGSFSAFGDCVNLQKQEAKEILSFLKQAQENNLDLVRYNANHPSRPSEMIKMDSLSLVKKGKRKNRTYQLKLNNSDILDFSNLYLPKNLSLWASDYSPLASKIDTCSITDTTDINIREVQQHTETFLDMFNHNDVYEAALSCQSDILKKTKKTITSRAEEENFSLDNDSLKLLKIKDATYVSDSRVNVFNTIYKAQVKLGDGGEKVLVEDEFRIITTVKSETREVEEIAATFDRLGNIVTPAIPAKIIERITVESSGPATPYLFAFPSLVLKNPVTKQDVLRVTRDYISCSKTIEVESVK